MTDPKNLDLLNEPIPDEWLSTRHCPTCGSTALQVSSDEVESVVGARQVVLNVGAHCAATMWTGVRLGKIPNG